MGVVSIKKVASNSLYSEKNFFILIPSVINWAWINIAYIKSGDKN